MSSIRISIIIFSVTLLCSCSGQLAGKYYLNNRDYESCIKEMSIISTEEPSNDTASFYLGRCYLAKGQAEKSISALKKAVSLNPQNAEYHFWLGINNWALADFDNELLEYHKALEINPDFLSANLYMGHSHFDKGDWQKALPYYEKVLKTDPYNPEALFNQAEARWQQGERAELTLLWKKYLDYYPDGVKGMRAASRLNALGDFSYRNFLIGQRVLTLRTPEFKAERSDMSYESMASTSVIAAIMEENKDLKINIITFVNGNKQLAKQRSFEIRKQILSGHPDIDSSRILLSWFGEPDKLKTSEGLKTINETVLFVTEVK